MIWTDPVMKQVAQLVSSRTGLNLETRVDNVEAGIRRAMTRARVSALQHYADILATDDNVLDDLVNELTVGETYFFRELGHFRFIQKTILPDILLRRGNLHDVRVWSAACASGEEAYSLAIVLEQAGIGARAHLMATDISREALTKARAAIYDAWSLRGDSARFAASYLVPMEKRYKLDPKIRQRAHFSYLNLALDSYPSFANGLWSMDLILCRNVLIYLDTQTVRLIASRLFETLSHGGWLITASSDPPLWDYAPFEVITNDDGVFYQRPCGESKNPLHGLKTDNQEALLNPIPEWQQAEIPEPDTATSTRDPASAPEKTLQKVSAEKALSATPWLEASYAMAQGRYRAVVELTRNHREDVAAAILHVRALANLSTEDALRACAEGIESHPFSEELHYLNAVLLLALGRKDEAIQSIQRVLYLDHTLAVAHFTMGSILRDQGEAKKALRAFRNTRDLCARQPPEALIPLADGEPAGRLAAIASRELSLLEATEDSV